MVSFVFVRAVTPGVALDPEAMAPVFTAEMLSMVIATVTIPVTAPEVLTTTERVPDVGFSL